MSRKNDFKYHITVPKGLINDPNGLIQFRGQYHVFYQWNQEDTTHANKSWGHVVSDDMVNWTQLPPALEPTDWYDKNGVYSGSAIAKDDVLYLFYTGNVKDEAGTRLTYQCLATSQDGVHFEKHGVLFTYPKGYTAHVRDPKVWWSTVDSVYYMLLGAQKEDLTGDTILYQSTNLYDWEFIGSILQFNQPLGYMWECPDLLFLESKDVFVFSPQGLQAEGMAFHNIFQTTYVAGQWRNKQFIPDTQKIIELDNGFEFYAPQTFQDDTNRTILYAWMGTMPPEMEQSMPSVKDGWIHHLSVPREITWQNNQLYQYPVVELNKRRHDKQTFIIQNKEEIVLPTRCVDIEITCDSAEFLNMTLCDEVTATYDKQTRVFSVYRMNWHTKEREVRQTVIANDLSTLRLLIEESSLEIFINKGENVFSMRYFTDNDNTLILDIKGTVDIYRMD